MANSLFQWLALRGRLARPIAPVRNFSERGCRRQTSSRLSASFRDVGGRPNANTTRDNVAFLVAVSQ
jgi:hypothetical protein